MQRLFILGACILFFVSISTGGKAQDCRVKVVDGDTIQTCEGRIRLRKCNAPEQFMSGGQQAAKRLDDLLVDAGWIELKCHDQFACRDIFNRPICDVILDGEDACDILVTEGYARPQRMRRACARVQPTGGRTLVR